MIDDPIVKEVRRVRDALSRKFGYDVDAIFDDLSRKQQKHRSLLVNLRKENHKKWLESQRLAPIFRCTDLNGKK